jgi:penicillin-binding protein 2
VTPLAINTATAALISGNLCSPKVVGTPKCSKMGVSQNSLNTVIEGMEAVCNQGGTANVFFDWEEKHSTKVACKTGTAETGVNDKTHAWFSLIYPSPEFPVSEDPTDRIVVTVLVEEGGEGSQVAAPIARELLDYWVAK